MDLFTALVLGGLALGVIAVVAIGVFHPDSGADVLDWKPARSPEAEAELELDDIAQMLAAGNEYRRRRGARELTEEDIEEELRGGTLSMKEANSDRNYLGGAVGAYAKDVLVDTQWVADHLEDPSIRIVEVDENPALYAEAHIPGAIGFDWQRDLQDQVKRDFLGPEDFGALFASRGIGNEHTIVLYGDRNNWFAAYTYWYLKYYGHDKVLLVNGPREKWIGEGRPTTADVPSHPAASFTAEPGDAAIRATRDEVRAALDADVALVDVRSPAEFSGELISPAGYEQEGAQRGGHIPGAASIPWASAVTEDGTFKTREQLAELYGGKGLTGGGPVIAYCRIGERSAHTWFVLHELLGEGDVKNYDGSWTEWGNLVDVPIETGA